MIPSDGGGGSAYSDDSYEKFRDEVEDHLKQFHDKIQEGIDWVADKFNDSHINSGFLHVVSPGTALLAHHFAGMLEDGFEKIWDAFEDVVKKIWDQVERLFATPMALMDISGDYQKAADNLEGLNKLPGRIDSYLSDGWSGDAYRSYGNASGEQAKALAGVATVLETAGTLCSTGAKQIYDTWHAVLAYILDQVSLVLSTMKDATDAGQWVTLDTGPVVKFVGQVLVNVVKFADTLAKFWTDNNSTGVAAWNAIKDGNPGLSDDNAWPGISGYAHDQMGHKGNWGNAA